MFLKILINSQHVIESKKSKLYTVRPKIMWNKKTCIYAILQV